MTAEPDPDGDRTDPVDDEVLVGCGRVEAGAVRDGLRIDAGNVVAHPVEQPLPGARFELTGAGVGVDDRAGVVLADLDQAGRRRAVRSSSRPGGR